MFEQHLIDGQVRRQRAVVRYPCGCCGLAPEPQHTTPRTPRERPLITITAARCQSI